MTRYDPHGNPLPRRMYWKRGGYYHVAANRWIALGTDYGHALREWARRESTGAAAQSVAQAIEAFFVERGPELAAKTLAGYRSSARRIDRVFGAMHLDDVQKPDVAEFLKRRTAAVSGNRDVAFLRSVYAWAIEQGWTEHNPAAVRRRRERPRSRTASGDEMARILAVAPPLWRALIQTASLLGTRPGELRLLRRVDAALDGPGINLVRSKTGAATLIEWSPALREAIAAALRAHARPSVWVFPSRKGGPYEETAFSRAFSRLCARAGVEGLQARDLRRTAASEAQDLEHARALLGHGSSAITRRVYRVRDKAKPIK